MKTTRRQQFWRGVRAELPLLLGAIPFGLIYGITALSAGIKPLAAQAMSSIVFAGSAQFVMAQLVAAEVPGLVIVATIFVVNLRHALYSASLAPHLGHLSLGWRSLLAYLLTDEAYAPSVVYYQQNATMPYKHWYLLGAGTILWVVWQISTALGVFLGAGVPANWPLDFALPLTFIALAIPLIKDRASLSTALVAGLTVLLASGLPFRLGLLAAAFAGMIAGLLVEKYGGATRPTEGMPEAPHAEAMGARPEDR